MAQIRFAPHDIEKAKLGARTDFERAEWCANRMVPHKSPSDDIQPVCDFLMEKTKRLVDESWRAIEVFAEALLQHGELDESQIDELIREQLIIK